MTQVISWNTHKTAAGYEWRVYAITYQQPTEVLKTGAAKTRAIAKRQAQRWMIYLQARQAGRPAWAVTPRDELKAEIAGRKAAAAYMAGDRSARPPYSRMARPRKPRGGRHEILASVRASPQRRVLGVDGAA